MQSLIQHEESSPALAEQTPADPPKPTERLRILHVIPQLRPGGTEYTLLRLIKGLGEETFDHRICATRGIDPDFAAEEGVAGKVFVAGNPDQAYQFPFFRLARIMRAFRPHVVHSRNWGGLEAVPAARFSGVPVVIHSDHGYEMDSLTGFPLRRRLFRRLAYAMTDVVFTNTKELRDYHAGQVWASSERIRVISNGVDTAKFAPQPAVRLRKRQELGLSEESVVLGSVGRLVKIKDYGTLLKAASLLIERGVDVRVLLVGAGPEMATLQKQAREIDHLLGRVLFAGASDRIPEYLNAMDVFVLPSFGEGMSNVLLEAMASGLPVVATRVGGNTELIAEERTGFLFSPGDVAGLADLLHQRFHDGASRQRLGVAARQRAISEFSFERMVREYRNLYMELAARHRLFPGQTNQTVSRAAKGS
jgi:sugar transferase (PEP-CTERM/EpsH1 system associated)